VTVHRDTVPPHVAAAIQKALAKLPADRFIRRPNSLRRWCGPGTVPITLDATAPSAAGPRPSGAIGAHWSWRV